MTDSPVEYICISKLKKCHVSSFSPPDQFVSDTFLAQCECFQSLFQPLGPVLTANEFCEQKELVSVIRSFAGQDCLVV